MKLRQLHVKIGLCSLNNDVLDFKKNFENIMQSIKECKRQNCSIRIGGELEVSGYACQDHFLEYDTIFHSWDVVKDIIVSGVTDGIVVDVGCPILHKAALYNGRVILYNSKVVGVRVKMIMADGGNYFQTRYFSSWKHPRAIDEFMLPQIIQEATKQKTVPIGLFLVSFNDTTLAYEICQEAWISNNPMIDAALDGAQIFVNVSASEIQRGKLKRKLQMLEEFTQRHGGAYTYVNMRGCLGQRNFYDGCCFFTENGKVKQLSQPFSLGNIQVTPVTININAIRTFRINNKSFQKQSHGVSLIPRVRIELSICTNSELYIYDSPFHKDQLKRKRAIYEFEHATFEPSAYLWDVLRKTKARGFYLPLSGGLDSSSAALIVYNMCFLVYSQIKNTSQSAEILSDLRKILRDENYVPKDARDLCHKLLFTVYLSTENSSKETRERAARVAQELGTNHRQVSFDHIYKSYQDIAKDNLGLQPKFKRNGGSNATDLALQNIQSRTRMVMTYYLAALEVEKQEMKGFLLVLGAANLDEALRGYYTKYDCSSSDINPIGSFSKYRLREIVHYFYTIHKFESINEVLEATPSAELRPLHKGEIAQTDEQDMGLTYAELCVFGKLRKVERLGPVSMFDRVASKETYEDPEELATKIKRFFTTYANNRHKTTTLPPTFFFDPESCDDNRYDMRPWFYATDWSYQFEIIDERVREFKENKQMHQFLRKKSCQNIHPPEENQTPHINVILPPAEAKSNEINDILNP